jgi:DNA-binding transcriptional MerR regulator
VLPEAGRTEAGYRIFAPESLQRARLLRTLRELGVGLQDIRGVLSAESSLSDVATAHVQAIDAQIRRLRLQRAVLAVLIRSTDPEELERMADLTNMTSEERRGILDEYLEAVFDGAENPVAERLQMGAPELPEDPTADQVAAWIELVGLLRDPDYIAASRRMALRGQAEAPLPDVARIDLAKAVGEHAGAALRGGIDPAAAQSRVLVEKIEAAAPGAEQDRLSAAERIEAFADRRVARYWTLVGIINGWPETGQPSGDALIDAWEWYARALRAHPRED